MSLWTKRHAIPIERRFYSEVKSIEFEGKIWVVCDKSTLQNIRNHHSRVFVFDPESDVFTEINRFNPESLVTYLHMLAADADNLYMWRKNFERSSFHLFKLNRSTLEWENLMTIRRDGYFNSIVIINQIMHILAIVRHPTEEVYLIRIDLQKREVVSTVKLEAVRPNVSWNGFLTCHNNTLFLMEKIREIRQVSEIMNDELRVIAREEHHDGSFRYFDANVFVSYFQRKLVFKIHNFDFNTLTWKKEMNNPNLMYDHSQVWIWALLRSCVRINGSIYTIFYEPDGKAEYELHVLDLQPKLTSICLDDLATRFSKKLDAQKLNVLNQKLPTHLRDQLKELMEWKGAARVD